ncbi:Abi family protein [Proteiniphilum sp.]|uniref:Abi family protein n=1 Tax=Proteiniphilum sp. TaxID=1926877 RepID=UPI003332F4B4
MKKATTIEEQIAIIQSRGIELDWGEEKAKEILSDIGYFRFGFYCFPFEKDYPNKKNRTHQYKKETKFSDIVRLYYLNVDLRNILLKYTARIEINVRTSIIYSVSNKFIDSPTWFADPKVMHQDYVSSFEKEIYNGLRNNYQVIKDHHRNHINDRYAPAWKTIEFLSFGAVRKLYSEIKDFGVKTAIANIYGITGSSTFENYIKTIIVIRNLCAHSNVLFDKDLPLSISRGPALFIDNTNKHKLYSSIKIVAYFLGRISESRKVEMMKEIHSLFENHKKYPMIREIIENNIGYRFS